MPRTMRAGFWIVAVGGMVDIVFHATGAGGETLAFAGHLLSLAGMLVVMTGVFSSAVRARARRITDGVGHVPR